MLWYFATCFQSDAPVSNRTSPNVNLMQQLLRPADMQSVGSQTSRHANDSGR